MSVLYFRDKDGVFKEVPAIVGRSAYQTAVKNGFKGTESQWLASLKGEPGHTPVKGVDYADGHTPVRGEDYWTEADKKAMGDYANACGATVESVTANKTLAEADMGKFLRVDAPCTITVPNLTVGMEIEIFRNTSGAVNITPSGVSFAVAGNNDLVVETQTISNTYASIALKQINNAVWSVQGAV
jgi:hypothetical protein